MTSENEKFSLSDVKKIPFKTLNRLLDRMRKYLKEDPVVKEMFKKYNVDIDEIDYIPMMFGDLDTSAKTDHCIIIFNYKLLTDGDFFKDFSYGVHEMSHYLQQSTNDKPTQSSDDGNYLDNKYEREAFQNQIGYISDHFGEKEAEEYFNHLLDHHDINNGDKKDELESVLLEKV